MPFGTMIGTGSCPPARRVLCVIICWHVIVKGRVMFNTKKLAALLEYTWFAIRRTGSSVLIIHDWAMFRVPVDALPVTMCPDRDGDYLYVNVMPGDCDSLIRPCPQSALAHFLRWQDACSAPTQSILSLTELEPGKHGYCRGQDATGNEHLLGRWLTDLISPSLSVLQKKYRFECLTNHRIRVQAINDDLPVAVLAECRPDKVDPLGLSELFRGAVAASVRLRSSL